MASRTITEIFDRTEEFAALLGAAELNANNDWEEQFAADLRVNFQRYGTRTYLSDSQLETLERIAEQ
ncbi:hypothetical protein SAMN05216229_10282 [Geopseudomonas sagittaria]|uniref:Uncharacterized protein n=1 Tax=Geopseudomonas sagittaria TaxID=1135990 RepID=A0A1I5PXN7_9GAMM|nr:hypothetical protein [Pseudomonas sagittaria]SFP38639.1 hypothetical protein SAMN05216229_10282 [Pseudomonas sagittaria]